MLVPYILDACLSVFIAKLELSNFVWSFQDTYVRGAVLTLKGMYSSDLTFLLKPAGPRHTFSPGESVVGVLNINDGAREEGLQHGVL